MSKDEYRYFKFGMNVYRYPNDEYSKENINPNLIENLVWKSKTECSFEKNELSYNLGEMINIKSIPSSGEIGDYVEQFHQMSQEEIIKKAVSEVLNKQYPDFPTMQALLNVATAAKRCSTPTTIRAARVGARSSTKRQSVKLVKATSKKL